MLQQQNIITKGGNKDNPLYGINKDYSLWKPLPPGVRSHHITKGGNLPLPKGVITPLPKGGDTKETITKETIQRKAPHKRLFGESVMLTEDQYVKLQARFPTDYESRIERLDLYINSKGVKYVSHYHTILAWAKEGGKEAQMKRDAAVMCTDVFGEKWGRENIVKFYK